ncbi:pectinesterase family protein [Ruania albidiflava]|uniref:pectinesterase family protein n=1 Tax=Ruania albidiflava TaxID=366586 RepID=UPI0003B631D4|nr:pectinesterase family protein [Ruania albidiflava]
MRGTARRILLGAAVAVSTLLAGTTAATADDQRPADEAEVHAEGEALLDRMQVPGLTTADGPIWSPVATGFAAEPTADLPHGTTGGAGGPIVVAWDSESLARYAARSGPVTILVLGSIQVDPFGSMIDVSSDTTIVGVGRSGELVGGGLRLDTVENVIVRNLTFRDSYIPGDWDGKSEENDNDGIRVDTSTHVWIDHNEFARLGDGLVDVRKDSTNVTLSWNIFRDHNKAIGVGWTDNVLTTITMHHNWVTNTYQRNGSIDNVAAGHLYNNLFDGVGQYGTMARGGSQLLVESSVYRNAEDPLVEKGPDSRIEARDNQFENVRGRRDASGSTVEPLEHYQYTADPVEQVERLVTRSAGPLLRTEHVPGTVRVALDGTGDYGSISAAVGAASRADHPVTIVVAPGTYREVVRVWPGADNLTIRGESGDAEDVVLTYDLAAGQEKFYGGTFGHTGSPVLSLLADDITLADLTVENAYDEEESGPSQALALRTAGDRIVLDDVRLLGNQDTYLVDSSDDAASRVYLRDSFVAGDVDFIYGPGTLVAEGSEIHSLDRQAEVNGYVTAAATPKDSAGFLFLDCRFTSEAEAGTVYLGRPWHPSSAPDTDPAVVVRDSWLGAHIATPAWTDMSGWPWEDAEFYEYANTGPGAESGEGRPQLSEEEAEQVTREAYLAGSDGWAPWR